MLEPLAIPLLLKSVDFLYAEYSKLLTERRKRREGAQEETKTESKRKPAPEKTIQNREEALKNPIDTLLWQEKEEDIRHLVDLLEIHYGNYRLLSKQYAQWTAALVPPIIANSLAREEKEIDELTQKLQLALTEVYGKDVQMNIRGE